MLLRITNMTQEELANYIEVSRASINMWLCDDSNMSYNSKDKIANKFQFPITFFNIKLEDDVNLHKVVFSTLSDSWKRIKNDKGNNEKIDKINQLLNELESDSFYNEKEEKSITDEEILDALINAYNPFTGECFENNHILNNNRIKSLLIKLNEINNKYAKINITKEDLDFEQKEMFEKLRKWRTKKRDSEGFYHSYMVFTDRELINMILANVKTKEELLNVKGIDEKKYQKYADELFLILTNKFYEDESQNESKNEQNFSYGYSEELPF